MENIRIAILDSTDTVRGYIDNDVPESMPYFDDEFHTYISGSAYTFTFTTFSGHKDSNLLVVGNHLSFKFKDKGYYLNISIVERDEKKVSVTAFGLSFELLNEDVKAYKSDRAMSFVEYIKTYGFEDVFEIGINEVSDKKISHEWTGTDTILSRLFSLANVFDAEIEFITELNDDYSLKRTVMNVYKKHSSNYQGLGKDRRGEIVKYGKEIKNILKTSDITELCTAIRPTGKDGLQLSKLGKKEELDENGNVLYYHDNGAREIKAPQSRNRFPSFVAGKDYDRWIVKEWEYDTDNVNTLYGQALAKLKEICVPKVKYDVDAYIDAEIGDTFTIMDEEYDPIMYLEARITEQIICFTNPKKSRTIFDNFKEVDSQIATSLIDQMNQMIEQNKTYQLVISSNNGVILGDDAINTTLTASVKDNGRDVTQNFTIKWYSSELLKYTGTSLTVDKSELNPSVTYRIEASESSTGIIKAYQEVTITKINEGTFIVSTDVEYAVSDNGDKPPKEGWQKEFPIVPEGKYLWIHTKVTYSDGHATDSYSVSHNGTNGHDGAPGAPGTPGEEPIIVKLISNKGQVFKNSSIVTELQANVYKGSKLLSLEEVNKIGTIKWYRNNSALQDTSLTMQVRESQNVLNVVYTIQIVKGIDVICADTISLASVTDIQGIYRYYQLAINKPVKPASYPPSNDWKDVEPKFELNNQGSLYYVDCTVFTDLTWKYTDVQLSSDYEAVKKLYADALQQIAEAEKKLSSDIQQTEDSIRTEVSEQYFSKDETQGMLGEISTKLEQTKNSFEFQFNNFKADLDKVNSENSAKFQEYQKYIRFEDGNIILGQVGNELVLTIKNNRISFSQGGQEVAYLSNNKLNVTDADITHSIRIGNFIFAPRPDGSLDFKKASD